MDGGSLRRFLIASRVGRVKGLGCSFDRRSALITTPYTLTPTPYIQMSTPSTQPIKQIASTEEIRAQFPAVEREHNGYPVAYFDGPGGTQTPRVVVDAVVDYLFNHNANTHWEYPTSHETDAIIEDARHTFADFLNASANEVVFGLNTTSMIYHLSRALGRSFGPGDEIVITELEHHANVAPWQALVKERGVTLHVAQFDTESDR